MKLNKKLSKIKFFGIAALLVISLFTTIATGIFNEKITINNRHPVNQPLFFAEIEFYLYVGDGCGCDPVENVSIVAYGLDTDLNDSNITNLDGFCILELEINSNYRVTIEDENDVFHIIIFDFLVVDDQTFTFHLQEKDDSVSQNFPLLYNMLQRIKKSINTLN